MIVFHAKRDGTVETTPSFVPQGSALADLVVASEMDYALCTIRLTPSSGLYIPDIVCNYVLQTDDTHLWTASLPSDVAKYPGSVGYQLIFTAADGHTQTSLPGTFNVPRGLPAIVPDSVGDLSQKTVNELYSILANLVSNITAARKDVTSVVSVLNITIPADDLSDGLAYIPVQNLGYGMFAVLSPSDADTAEEAARIKLSVDPDVSYAVSTSGIVKVVCDKKPGADLNMIVTVLKGFGDTQPKAAMFGLDYTKSVYGISSSAVTINQYVWENNTYSVKIDNVRKGVITLLLPSNEATRVESQAAQITAKIAGEGYILFEAASAPASSLTFIVIHIDRHSGDLPVLSLLGVGGGGSVSESVVESIVSRLAYSASNPPPYPVTTVNGKSGDVKLSSVDVGADAYGTAAAMVRDHNVDNTAHPHIVNKVDALSLAISLIVGSDVNMSIREVAGDAVSEHNNSTIAHPDIRSAVATITQTLSFIVGGDQSKSMREIAASVIADALKNAPESLDTLEEIAAWIEAHPEDVAEIVKRIADLETAMIDRVSKTDIINKLDSNDLDKPLSAAMGKQLAQAIENLKGIVNNKQTAAQVATAISAALTDYITLSKAAELYQPKGNYQPAGDYADRATTEQALENKQPKGDYADRSTTEQALAGKQPIGDYATNTALTQGLEGKQPAGDYLTPTTGDMRYAKPSDIPTTPEAVGADPAGAAKAVSDQIASDLENYYQKRETYSKTKIDELVAAIPKFAVSVVDALPTSNISTTTVYLVKDKTDSGDLYTEYIYVEKVNDWEELGRQRVDLTGYVTSQMLTDALSSALANYAKKSDIPTVPTALKNPYKLTILGKTYDGSSAISIDISDIVDKLPVYNGEVE